MKGLGDIEKIKVSMKTIPAKDAYEEFKKGTAVFIDVRRPSEYKLGHIKNSILHTLAKLDDTLESIPKDKLVIVYCRSDRRSGEATDVLKDIGVKALNMVGGLKAWKALGYPTV